MANSRITIDVELDESKVPSNIKWHATDSNNDQPTEAKAMMLSIWDGQEKAALRIDLWTQKMMVDEMADFYYQTLMTMADTYKRATLHDDLAAEMKNFAKAFFQKSRAKQLNVNKL